MTSSSSFWQIEESGTLICEENILTSTTPRKGSPANALWKTDSMGLSLQNPSAQCYKITIDQADDGIWVGLCPENKFGRGWKLKALCYGGPGNLSDGSALVRQEYGPALKRAGMVVHILAEIVTGGRLDVYYAVDGKGLGKAFEIDRLSSNVSPFYPVISFCSGSSNVRVSIVREATIPQINFFEPSSSVSSPPSCFGSWQCADIPSAKLTLSVDWSLSVKVANIISTNLSPTHPHTSTGRAVDTRMMAPPHLQDVENRVCAMLEGVRNVSLDEGTGELVIEYVFNNEPAFLRAQPFLEATATVRSVKQNQLSWLH